MRVRPTRPAAEDEDRPRQPQKISGGDEFVVTNPLVDASGAKIGALHALCTATRTSKRFDGAGFVCTIVTLIG